MMIHKMTTTAVTSNRLFNVDSLSARRSYRPGANGRIVLRMIRSGHAIPKRFGHAAVVVFVASHNE